jgi:hypothetical protein
MSVKTHLDLDALPELVWKVEGIDSKTSERIPMFVFHLTEAGLTMDWQPEGLNNQYLYDTILSSLGFLQLSVAELPETMKEIPLFAPVYATPMKVADFAGLFESESPEIVSDLPFSSALWQPIFAEKKPSFTLRLEVRAEPAGDWTQIQSVSASEMLLDIRTSTQSEKLAESGKTVFENIVLPFTVWASLEKVVWKGGDYDKQLQAERERNRIAKMELEQKISQLNAKIFDVGINEADRSVRETCVAELEKCNKRFIDIERLLEKLPSAYTELRQNESWNFHYSVFLESAEGKRKLLLLTTGL